MTALELTALFLRTQQKGGKGGGRELEGNTVFKSVDVDQVSNTRVRAWGQHHAMLGTGLVWGHIAVGPTQASCQPTRAQPALCPLGSRQARSHPVTFLRLGHQGVGSRGRPPGTYTRNTAVGKRYAWKGAWSSPLAAGQRGVALHVARRPLPPPRAHMHLSTSALHT